MTQPIDVSRAAARRFLVMRHLLAPPRSLPAEPASVMAVVERLGSLQFDPLEVAGRNHDLVLLARIAGYQRDWTDRMLYEERRLYETYNKGLSLVPTTEMPWYRLTWDANRIGHEGSTFDQHGALVEELLDRIRRDGPLSSTDVEPRASIEWYWRPTNQVRAILEALGEAGILGLSRRDGNRRVYDLVERLFPGDLLTRREPERDQRRHKLLSRYRAHGLLGRSGSAELWLGTAPALKPAGPNGEGPTRPQLLAELLEAGELTPVTVSGIRGERFVLTGELPILAAAEREVDAETATGDWEVGRPAGHDPGVAFLAPLDPYVWDREFLRTLHEFDYVWEVYVPERKRRWGYYVLPILYGDRLVGRIEPRIDRKTNTLRVIGLWWETGFDPLAATGFIGRFAAALAAHRAFGGVTKLGLPRTTAHRPLVAALRERQPEEVH
ncbi:MAG TPA: crosslink repair DNA glycosylase YcaQ family protein [Patescibacteria group bacterium]|nr:crosslink repair DNA glycosylase YcaQ family protein [Patescibacteria group bacterium]